jgi:hypothetical protein
MKRPRVSMFNKALLQLVTVLAIVDCARGVIDKPRDICSSELCACSEKPKGIHHVVCTCPPHREVSGSYFALGHYQTTTMHCMC